MDPNEIVLASELVIGKQVYSVLLPDARIKLQFLFSDMDVLQTEIKLKTDKLRTIQDQFGFMESGLLKQKDRCVC